MMTPSYCPSILHLASLFHAALLALWKRISNEILLYWCGVELLFDVLFCQEETVMVLGERVDQATLESSTLAKMLSSNLSSLNVLLEGKLRQLSQLYIPIHYKSLTK